MLVELKVFIAYGGNPPIFVSQKSIVLTSGSDGHYETTMPCYTDTTNTHHTYLEIHSGNINVAIRQSSTGGGSVCTESDTFWQNSLRAYGTAVGPDNQNFGPDDTCPLSVGMSVNTTNGNMWLRERDYHLPGTGESIAVDRLYPRFRISVVIGSLTAKRA